MDFWHKNKSQIDTDTAHIGISNTKYRIAPESQLVWFIGAL